MRRRARSRSPTSRPRAAGGSDAAGRRRPGTSLLLSLQLRPRVEPARWPELTVLVVARGGGGDRGRDRPATEVKHPNDVLVRGRKVAGVLAEATEGRVVLGIGINVNVPPRNCPPTCACRPRPYSPSAAGPSTASSSPCRCSTASNGLRRLERSLIAPVERIGSATTVDGCRRRRRSRGRRPPRAAHRPRNGTWKAPRFSIFTIRAPVHEQRDDRALADAEVQLRGGEERQRRRGRCRA